MREDDEDRFSTFHPDSPSVSSSTSNGSVKADNPVYRRSEIDRMVQVVNMIFQDNNNGFRKPHKRGVYSLVGDDQDLGIWSQYLDEIYRDGKLHPSRIQDARPRRSKINDLPPILPTWDIPVKEATKCVIKSHFDIDLNAQTPSTSKETTNVDPWECSQLSTVLRFGSIDGRIHKRGWITLPCFKSSKKKRICKQLDISSPQFERSEVVTENDNDMEATSNFTLTSNDAEEVMSPLNKEVLPARILSLNCISTGSSSERDTQGTSRSPSGIPEESSVPESSSGLHEKDDDDLEEEMIIDDATEDTDANISNALQIIQRNKEGSAVSDDSDDDDDDEDPVTRNRYRYRRDSDHRSETSTSSFTSEYSNRVGGRNYYEEYEDDSRGFDEENRIDVLDDEEDDDEDDDDEEDEGPDDDDVEDEGNTSERSLNNEDHGDYTHDEQYPASSKEELKSVERIDDEPSSSNQYCEQATNTEVSSNYFGEDHPDELDALNKKPLEQSFEDEDMRAAESIQHEMRDDTDESSNQSDKYNAWRISNKKQEAKNNDANDDLYAAREEEYKEAQPTADQDAISQELFDSRYGDEEDEVVVEEYDPDIIFNTSAGEEYQVPFDSSEPQSCSNDQSKSLCEDEWLGSNRSSDGLDDLHQESFNAVEDLYRAEAENSETNQDDESLYELRVYGEDVRLERVSRRRGNTEEEDKDDDGDDQELSSRNRSHDDDVEIDVVSIDDNGSGQVSPESILSHSSFIVAEALFDGCSRERFTSFTSDDTDSHSKSYYEERAVKSTDCLERFRRNKEKSGPSTSDDWNITYSVRKDSTNDGAVCNENTTKSQHTQQVAESYVAEQNNSILINEVEGEVRWIAQTVFE